MANNVKENKFRSKLGQGKKIFLSRNRGKNDKKIKKKKKKNSQHCGKILLKK